MKILFSKKMAFVYGGLSICALIGFIITLFLTGDYNNMRLPIDLMPVTHMVHPLFFAGIILGGIAVLCRWGISKFTVSYIFAVGILLTGIFEGYWAVLQYVSGTPSQLSGVIYSEKVRNHDLGHDVVIAQTLCVWDGYVGYFIDIYEGTKIYEQNGATQQKRQVGLDALQPGQMVDIDGEEWVKDPEIKEYLFTKYNPLVLDVFYFVGATEITIHKGESLPIETSMENSDCYGFMSAP